MTGELGATTIALVIAGMAIANFLIRFFPMAVLSRLELPAPLLRWLSYVPISVMGALVAGEVLRPAGQWQPPLANPGLYSAALTMLTFRLTRSFLGSTVVGVVAFVALRSVM